MYFDSFVHLLLTFLIQSGLHILLGDAVQVESIVTRDTTGNTPSDIQFGQAPSEGLSSLMSALHDMYVDNPGFDGGGNGNDQGKEQKISPTKRKGSSKKKDEKSNNAAKKREINKWKKYFDKWRSKQPVSMSPDEDFMELARKMIDVNEHIDQHIKLRQHYVLDNGFQINTFEEMKLWWTTVKSFGKVPRGDYEKNDCPVCKCGPERKLVDLSDHNCPYCHDCFNNSGWKKACILLEECECNKDHAFTEV